MGWLDTLLGARKKSGEDKEAESLNKKALACVQRNELDQAEKLLLEAVHVAPRMSAAHHNLGAVYLAQRRLAPALKEMNRAVQLAPGDIESQIAVAKICQDMGKKEEALAAYERICQDFPEDWRSHISLGNALLERDRVDEAVPHLEKAVLLKSREELTHLVLAAAYERQGELGKAIKQYKAARGVTRLDQNRSAASKKMHELQLQQAQQKKSASLQESSE